MSINIVIVYEENNRRALSTIINKLRLEGFNVYEQLSDGWQTYASINNREKAKDIANFYKDKDIDFGIVVTHNGNPSMIIFQKIVKPKYGYYDIEHDIFSSVVEKSPPGMRAGTFSFTKLQTGILKKAGVRVIEAEWYKFDNCDCYDVVNEDLLKNAVVVDTMFAKKDEPFPYGHLFDNLYLKNYRKGFQNIKSEGDNLVTNLDEWYDTQAIADMQCNGYFWFSIVSSAIVEALLMNRLPILWSCTHHIKNEEPVDDIISHVFFKNTWNDEFHEFNKGFLFVTENNIDYKIDILRKDPERRSQVMTTLRSPWVFDGKRKKVSEELVTDIKRILSERGNK